MLFLIASLAVSVADTLTGTGVSHQLAVARAKQLTNVRYELRFDVTNRDTLVGHAKVQFTKRAAGDVVLDFRGYSFANVSANGKPLSPASRNGHVVIPGAALTTGENAVDIDFRSAIAPAGASVIRFRDATDGADYLYTLLVPADANQLFPCFDQPDLKAKVTLTLTTPAGWKALANGALDHVDSSATSVWHFAESDPISTYLVAFAAGPWAVRTQTINGRPISLYVRASRAKEAEADSLIAMNARAIGWLEKYTDRAFPFQKFDFLLAPAFPFGGMEHPGAVFYNEESFIYRERPTLNQLLGRQATIFHEVSHQWFGDYTTMRWFDDLWLKEGFATYLAAVMQADLEPNANAWKSFYLRNKPAAYGVDVTTGTTPVWQQLANLDQAKSNYGAIVYNKAPGILKQLNYLVGDTAFRNGLREYLRTHAYGNATWGELLNAVGTASQRDLDVWGRSYILRPGMPVIDQQVVVKDGQLQRIALTQAPVRREISSTWPWQVRVEVLLGYLNGESRRIPAEVGAGTTEIPIAGVPTPDFVFANARDFGYTLVRLDDRSVSWLEKNIGKVHDDFLRAMLWGAMWDQVRDARLDPERYVRMAMRELPLELDEQLVPTILGRVSRSVSAYMSGPKRDALVAQLEDSLTSAFNDKSRTYGVRKNNLDTFIGIAQTRAGIATLTSMLDSTTLAGAPLRPPTRWAIVSALVSRGAADAERRLADEMKRDSTTEGKRRAFAAGAARADSATKARYWQRYFGDKELNEDWVTASLRGFNDPAQDAVTRRYLIPALDSLQWVQKNRRIFFLGSWVGAFIEGQRSPEALALIDDFLKRKSALPHDLRDKILQTRDELERTVAIRRTFR